MRRLRVILYLLALAGVCPGSRAQTGTDPGIPDTVRVDSVTSFVTGIGIVPVTFFNDEDLRQIEVTLRHYSNQVRIDSFSFAGGRVNSDTFIREVLISADSSTVTIFASTFSSQIDVGRGLLGKLYLSYSQTITPQSVTIDSTTWTIGPIRHSTSLRAVGASQTFKPQFISGLLNIVESPASFDSVWVADAQAKAGDPVAVDVYAFNERNLAKISLALDYGSADLALDSVSFAHTRSETAPSKTVQPQASLHKVYTVIEFADQAPLAPGLGVVARLHFTVAPATPEGVILIDSTTVGIISNTRFLLTPTDGSISFVPLFRAGRLTITTATDVQDVTADNNLPSDYSLAQNYPNPFNPTTNIELSLPRAGHVEIEVFNILGRRVRTLLDGELPAGVHGIVFDGRGDQGSVLATGVYFYRVTAGDFQDTKKMLLVK